MGRLDFPTGAGYRVPLMSILPGLLLVIAASSSPAPKSDTPSSTVFTAR